MSKAWSTLTECVRAGTAVNYQEMVDREGEWMEAFISAMHQGGLARATELVKAVGVEGVNRLLDVGGGSGVYSIAFAQAGSSLQAEVIDLPFVVKIAQRHIAEAGLAQRVTTRIADLRSDDLGENFDLILLSAICHMLSPRENRDLFVRCSRALAPEGRVVIRDFFLEPEKTTPRSAALFAVHMLVATEGGGTYTEEEFRDWLQEAGLENVSRLAGDLIVAKRK
jgi:cyclopropane fatty-acyl-phospholipid synthase-like methyltransferase